jgi:DNA-binding CsgD family transcriptional regulator
MSNVTAARLELSEVAASPEPLGQLAEALVTALRRLVDFDGAWIVLADPHRSSSTSLADADLDESTVAYLSGPRTARDIEVTGVNRGGQPLSPSDLPYPSIELPTWAECLIPAGYHEALAVALFAPGGRHVGFLALLSDSKSPPSPEQRRRLRRLTPVLAHAVDPMRSLLAAARLVEGATAGVVLREDGRLDPLPGLGDHTLLAPDSPALDAARAAVAAGHVYTSFLWPMGGRHAPGGHTRITAMARTDDVPSDLTGMALVSPPGDLRHLTPRELEVLGLLIDGRSNSEIARVLVVAQRTVAAHLEHILAKMSAPTRTLAAVRAEREGLYVPRPVPTAPVGM